MNANDRLERRLTDFYQSESPPRAPDWVLRSALQTIDDTQQRRVLIRVPWRFPHMNNVAKMAIAAVVVIAIGALGLSVLRPSGSSNVGGQPTASPTPSPSISLSPSPSSPSSSASVVSPAALSETFTSERHGFSISFPAGWVPRPATSPWTTGIPDYSTTAGDVMYDPVLDGSLWIMVASQPLAGKSAEQWVADAVAGLGSADFCETPSQPATIDGVQGRDCGSAAAVATGERGYVVKLYTSGDVPAVVAGYDQAYFEDVLATLQLQPEDAVDTAP